MLRYRFRTKCADVTVGWLDGRRGIPDVSAPAPYRSPKLERLRAEQSEALRQLEEAAEASTMEQRKEIIEMRHQARDLASQLTTLEARLARHLAEGPDTTGRLGEEDLTAEFIELRRRREFESRTVRFESRISSMRSQQTLFESRADVLNRTIASAYESLRVQQERQLAHYQRRQGAYLAGVSRTHPDPPAIARHFANDVSMGSIDLTESGTPDRRQPTLWGQAS